LFGVGREPDEVEVHAPQEGPPIGRPTGCNPFARTRRDERVDRVPRRGGSLGDDRRATGFNAHRSASSPVAFSARAKNKREWPSSANGNAVPSPPIRRSLDDQAPRIASPGIEAMRLSILSDLPGSGGPSWCIPFVRQIVGLRRPNRRRGGLLPPRCRTPHRLSAGASTSTSSYHGRRPPAIPVLTYVCPLRIGTSSWTR
jgi:hypothetical protein